MAYPRRLSPCAPVQWGVQGTQLLHPEVCFQMVDCERASTEGPGEACCPHSGGRTKSHSPTQTQRQPGNILDRATPYQYSTCIKGCAHLWGTASHSVVVSIPPAAGFLSLQLRVCLPLPTHGLQQPVWRAVLSAGEACELDKPSFTQEAKDPVQL